MATKTKGKIPEGPALIDAIVAERESIVEMRERHERELTEANHRLAVLVAATREDPDPDVNPTAAARAMGLHKQRAFQMIASLDASN